MQNNIWGYGGIKMKKIQNIVQCTENIIKIGVRDWSYDLFIIYKYDLLFTQCTKN